MWAATLPRTRRLCATLAASASLCCGAPRTAEGGQAAGGDASGAPSTAGAAAHSGTAPDADAGDAPSTGPFVRGALGVEFTGGLFREAWNFNGNTEALIDGSAGVWWTFLRGSMLVVEFHATRVFQESSRNAFVHALTPVLRFRIWERPDWHVFTDLGPGISWSDTAVPPRGTRFNYLALAGGGVMRRVGRQTRAIASFRWLHLSNASLEGRSRNPDIEALGGYAGVSIAF